MHVRKIALGVGLCGALMASTALAKGAVSAQEFVTKASVASKFEIDSSKLALEKSKSSDVQSFAQQMIDDHTKASKELEDAIDDSDADLQAADRLDTKHQKLIGKLDAANGKAFDSQYLALQLSAHKEAVNLFNDYAANGKDEELQEFAAETLPTLKTHLRHVQRLKINQ